MKKKRRKFFYFLLFLTFVFSALYLSVHTEKGFELTWARLIRMIPGKIEYESLKVELWHPKLEIKNLRYSLPSGKRFLELKHFYAELRRRSLIRGRAVLKELTIDGVDIDLTSLPPSSQKGNSSKILELLNKRMAVERSSISNVHLQLKQGFLDLPSMEFSYQPALVGQNLMRLVLTNLQGEIAKKPLSVGELRYEGDFSTPSWVKEVFLFKKAQGRFSLKGGKFSKYELADLSTEASFDGENLDLKDFEVEFAKQRFRLSLKYAPFLERIEGKLATIGFIKMQDFPGVAPRVARVYKQASLQLDFQLQEFSLEELEGGFTLKLRAEQNSLNPKNPNADLTIVSQVEKGKLNLNEFRIKSEKSDLSGKGSIDFRQMQLNTSFQAKSLDLRTTLGFFSDIEIVGYSDLSGDIKGPLKMPDFQFQGRTVEAGYKFLRFGENAGNFEILNGNMKYRGATPANASYQGSVEVSTPFIFDGKRRRTELKTTFSNLEGSELLDNKEMKGKVSGTYQMEVAQGNLKGALQTQVKGFRMYQFVFGDLEVEGKLVNKTFSFPQMSFQPPGIERLQTVKPTVFQFNDAGFQFQGAPIQGMQVSGNFLYNRGNVLHMDVSCQRCSAATLLASLEYPPLKGEVDGKSKLDLIIGNFPNSKIQSQITRLEIPVGEGVLSNAGALNIGYRQGAFHFDQVALAYNQQQLRVQGSFSTSDTNKSPLDLNAKGTLDLSLLSQFKQYVRDASGPAEVDLKVRGTTKDPRFGGSIRFANSEIQPRLFRTTIENLRGVLKLEEDRVVFQDLQGEVADGSLKVSGTLWHQNFQIKKADLKANAREIVTSEPGTYKIYLSGNVVLKGTDPNLLLSGNLDITEARYIKNFEIKDYLLKPKEGLKVREPASGFDNLNLDLKIKSPGEVLIKNNIAELYLKTDLQVSGTKAKPKLQGALEVLDGKINYFKLSFENARGVIDFRDPNRAEPYVQVAGQSLFERPSESIRITAQIQGFLDNLQLSFGSDPPLEKREILALLFTGALPNEGQKLSGTNIASSVLGSQLTGLIEKPITGLTGLDVFRLEAPDPDSKSLSSLVIGKQLTDRLTLEFKTDLGIEDSLRSIQMEYLIFDNLLFKAGRSTNGKFKLDLTFRFKGF